MKTTLSTADAPAAIGPYSQALDLGDLVFVSGQLPVDPATGAMPDTVEAQAAQSLANIKAILAEAGLRLAHVGKTVLFLAGINDFAAVNGVFARGVRPALPGPQLRPGSGHPQGGQAGDRVHRQAVKTIHKKGQPFAGCPF